MRKFLYVTSSFILALALSSCDLSIPSDVVTNTDSNDDGGGTTPDVLSAEEAFIQSLGSKTFMVCSAVSSPFCRVPGTGNIDLKACSGTEEDETICNCDEGYTERAYAGARMEFSFEYIPQKSNLTITTYLTSDPVACSLNDDAISIVMPTQYDFSLVLVDAAGETFPDASPLPSGAKIGVADFVSSAYFLRLGSASQVACLLDPERNEFAALYEGMVVGQDFDVTGLPMGDAHQSCVGTGQAEYTWSEAGAEDFSLRMYLDGDKLYTSAPGGGTELVMEIPLLTD